MVNLNSLSGKLHIPPPKTDKRTSDQLSHLAKKILDDWDIRKTDVAKVTYSIIEKMKHDFKLPQKGEQIRIRTQSMINLISVVIFTLNEFKCIDELIITTYTFNREAFNVIIDLVKAGHIKKLNVVLASSYRYRMKEKYEEIKQAFRTLKKSYDVTLTFSEIHLKITLIRCGENYFQIEGSMNYSLNNLVEQLLIENDRGSFEHDKKFIEGKIMTCDRKATERIV